MRNTGAPIVMPEPALDGHLILCTDAEALLRHQHQLTAGIAADAAEWRVDDRG